ncbi:DUF4367 domain-containing protein [Brevibacillus laterosporus]|uniref:DUF4367 domain-containing protein n=1 Tax=Brevibacillus laterosporus TaxID=1465 RepID=UPI003D1F1DEE
MKDRDPSSKMKELLHSKKVPHVNVTEKVLDAIYAKQKQTEVVKVKKKIGFFLAVGLLVGASSVFAAVEVLQLKNDKGEVAYEVSKVPNQQQMVENLTPKGLDWLDKKKKELERISDIVNKVLQGVEEGKAVAIYTVPKFIDESSKMTYTEGKHPNIDVVAKPYELTNHKNLQEKLGKQLIMPSELAGGFGFQEAFVHFKPEQNYDAKAMKEEAEKNQKEYVVHEVKMSEVLDQTFVRYKSAKGEIVVNVMNKENRVKNGRITVGGEHDNAEKVKVGDNEAAYTTKKRPDGDMHKRISWIKNGTSLGYSMWTFSQNITKEDLIKAAETLQTAK